MKRNRPIPFLLALAASLFLAGCWGSTKEESRSVPTTPPTLQGDNLSAVAQMCATCHSVLPSHAPLAIRANPRPPLRSPPAVDACSPRSATRPR